MAKEPLNYAKLLTSDTNIETSATVANAASLPSVQVSVRLDGTRYAKLKKIGIAQDKKHKDILIEAFDLWLKENNL